jgi:hypothetical protein
LIPELADSKVYCVKLIVYLGDELNLTNYPHLKQIIQLSFTTVRGTIKFRDHMVYSKPSYTNLRLPQLSESDTVYEVYREGRKEVSYTNADLTRASEKIWDSYLNVA